MKKLMILFAIVIMITGGTVGVLKWLGAGPFAEEEVVDPNAVKQVDRATRFLDMDPISIPLIQGDRVVATVKIEYKLETVGQDNFDTVREVIRPLNSAIFRDLYAYIPRTLHTNETLDVTLIKYRIAMICDRYVGNGVVHDALIQSMTNTQN